MNKDLQRVVFLLLSILMPAVLKAQDAKNMLFLSVWDDKNFQTLEKESKYSSCWGYTDPKGNKCAIFGSRNYTYFLNINDPRNPVLVHLELGRAADVIWREYRTYKNFVYAVNDGADGSLQIFDMSDFPKSVDKVYDSDTLFARGHTLVIESDRLYIHGGAKKNKNPFTLGIFDLKANPANPSPLAYYNDTVAPYIHDAIVKNDTVFAFSGYSGLFIYDTKDPQQIKPVSNLTQYPAKGYCHSGAFSEDKNYLFMADEVPTDLPMKIVDIKDPQNINFIDTFRSNKGFTAHNPFVRGHYLYVSYYEDGVQIWDIQDPTHPFKVAYFDTYPDTIDPASPYHGCWNVYPYFGDKLVVAIDRKYGLYTLYASNLSMDIDERGRAATLNTVYPNPFTNQVVVDVPTPRTGKLTWQLVDIAGRILKENSIADFSPQAQLSITDLDNLTKGIYILQIQTTSNKFAAKIIKE